ncbi:hypothetical protein EZS27_003590 [termite gut metagenome]|uniref:Uncharacterized protein n=1 Tax=termite gut metagenome TaxID=433724 RepID=A0A5J4SUW2_9ZZZZ
MEKPNYSIRKNRNSVSIELKNDVYDQLFKELKFIIESYSKGNTLYDLKDAFPVCMILMGSHEVVGDLKVGDVMSG